MPKPRRMPHVMVEAEIGRNGKMAELPSDTARLGYIYVVLGEAKLLRPSGRFTSRRHWTMVSGRFCRFLKNYLDLGLMHEAPNLCPKCAQRFGEVPKGTLVVHDWHEHQNDPGAAERAEDWRRNHPEPDPEWAGIERSSNADQTAIERSLNGSSVPTTGVQSAFGQRTLARAQGEHEVEEEVERKRTSPARVARTRAREGLPNVTDAVAAAWEAASGRTLLAAGTYAQRILDDTSERHGEVAVVAAIERARACHDVVPEANVLATQIRNDLDPLPSRNGNGKAAEVDDFDARLADTQRRYGRRAPEPDLSDDFGGAEA